MRSIAGNMNLRLRRLTPTINKTAANKDTTATATEYTAVHTVCSPGKYRTIAELFECMNTPRTPLTTA